MTLGDLRRSSKVRQPPRADADDNERLNLRVVAGRLVIATADKDGCEYQSIMIGERTAWSLIGLLCLFVGLKLPAAIEREIKL